jgi:hypothetical protein
MEQGSQSMFELFRKWQERHFSDPQRIILGVMLLIGAGLIYFFGSLLAPVFISVVIAYLLEGLVTLIHRSRFPRLPAVYIVFSVFMVGMIVMIVWLIPLTAKQVTQLIQQLPNMLATVQSRLIELPTRYPDLISQSQVQEAIGFPQRRDYEFGQTGADHFRCLCRGVDPFGGLPGAGAFYGVLHAQGQGGDPQLGQTFFAQQHGPDRVRLAGGEFAGDQLYPWKGLGAVDHMGHQLRGIQGAGITVCAIDLSFRRTFRHYSLHRRYGYGICYGTWLPSSSGGGPVSLQRR